MGKKRVLSLVLACALVVTAGVFAWGSDKAKAEENQNKFESSDASVVTVDQDGDITAVAPGSATVTEYYRGTNEDGSYLDWVAVYVREVTVVTEPSPTDASGYWTYYQVTSEQYPEIPSSYWPDYSYEEYYEEEEAPEPGSAAALAQEYPQQSYSLNADGTVGTSVKAADGTSVSGSTTVFPIGTTFASVALTSADANYNTAVKAVAANLSNATVARVFDYNVTSIYGAVHEVGEYVTVSVPRPAGIAIGEGQTLGVYLISDSGKVTRCDTTYNDCLVSFKTNHFSTYAFVVEDVSRAGTSTSPKTGEE